MEQYTLTVDAFKRMAGYILLYRIMHHQYGAAYNLLSNVKATLVDEMTPEELPLAQEMENMLDLELGQPGPFAYLTTRR